MGNLCSGGVYDHDPLLRAKMDEAERKIEYMLINPPVSRRSDKQITKWKELKPMTLMLFRQYWIMLEGDFSKLTDIERCNFDKWDVAGAAYEGMRCATSGKRNGVIREITAMGDINERTSKDNRPHGLFRSITSNRVHIKVFNDGIPIAFLEMDHELNEIRRYGEQI